MAKLSRLLSTAEAAQELGISSGTIRSWLSRYPEAFHQGIHLETVEGRKVWTEAGVELLRTRVNAGDVATEIAAQRDASDVAPVPTSATPADDASAPDPIQQFADRVAWTVLEHQLPGSVQASINRILANPTELEQQRLLDILGRVGSGVTLARMSAIFAGGLQQAIAASQTSMKALEGMTNED